MATRKIRNSWWVDVRVEGVRYRKRSPEQSRAGAQAYEFLLRRRLARGEPVDGSPSGSRTPTPTLEEFVHEKWWPTYVLPNNRLATRIGKESILRVHLLPRLGRVRIDRIDAQELEEYTAAEIRTGRAPQTVNKDLRVLRKCLQSAMDWGLLAALPKMRYLREDPPRFTFLSPEECERLLAAAPAGRWRTMILLALHTGARIGELLGLHWEDIDLARRTLTVRRTLVHGELGPPKSNRERHIPLTAEVCEAFDALPGERRGFVFRTRNGRPLRGGPASYALRRTCDVAGIRGVGWHVLRHTFASHLATRGVSLQCIRELLGHADMRMTLRYAHLAPSALRDAVAVLETAHPSADSGQPAGNAPTPMQPLHAELLSTEPRFAVAQI